MYDNKYTTGLNASEYPGPCEEFSRRNCFVALIVVLFAHHYHHLHQGALFAAAGLSVSSDAGP